ncbi:MAG: hypothetical protein R3B57_06890 [Phycisphaerales bacterium]
MTPTRPLLVSALAVSVLVVSGVMAQPGSGRPAGGGGGQPFSAERFVDRLMEADANGDGKLTREEMPGRFGEQVLAEADTNGDQMLDREELTKYAEKRFAERGGPRVGGQGGGPGAGFEGQMRRAGNAAKALRASEMNADTLEDDLRQIGDLEAALVMAKSESGSVQMSPQAKEKFGDDEAAYRKDMREDLIEAVTTALEIERALLDGRHDEARASLDKLLGERDDAHDLFQKDI